MSGLAYDTLPFINYLNFQVKARKQNDSSMDWSADTPQTSSTLCIPLSEHVSSPCVPLPQGSSSSNNVLETSCFESNLLNYYSGLRKPYLKTP